MSKQEKAQRKELFTLALKYLEDDIADPECEDYSLCYCMVRAWMIVFKEEKWKGGLKKQFPELEKVRPKDGRYYHFWWNNSNYEVRRAKLQKIINMYD